jgi:hypothetical protein
LPICHPRNAGNADGHRSERIEERLGLKRLRK